MQQTKLTVSLLIVTFKIKYMLSMFLIKMKHVMETVIIYISESETAKVLIRCNE